MGLLEDNIVQDKYLKLYKSKSSLIMHLLWSVVIVMAILWFKNWLFSWLFDLTGLSVMADLAEGSMMFWIMLVLFLFFAGYTLLKWKTTNYEIFTDRVVVNNGIVARNKLAVDMHDFGQIKMKVGVWGRILGYGTVTFEYRMLGPAGDLGVDLYNIDHPEKYIKILTKILNRATKDGGGKDNSMKGQEDITSETAGTAVIAKAVMEQNEAVETMRQVEPESTPIEGEIQF